MCRTEVITAMTTSAWSVCHAIVACYLREHAGSSHPIYYVQGSLHRNSLQRCDTMSSVSPKNDVVEYKGVSHILLAFAVGVKFCSFLLETVGIRVPSPTFRGLPLFLLVLHAKVFPTYDRNLT